MKRLFFFLLFGLACTLCHGAEFPWESSPPPAIIQQAVQPDQVLDEEPANWRPVLTPLVRPLVDSCATAREAVLAVASRLPQATGVHYSMDRRKPSMNALESLQEKKVSCTGQSILLVCALRSIGIPARAVGVATWGHIPGNHTWVEAWVDEQWRMIEFGESEFNTPWVMENIGMLDPSRPEQRVYAVAGQETGLSFPLAWDAPCRLPAEDVTARYQTLSQQWYETHGLPPNTQRLMLDMRPRLPGKHTVYLEDETGALLNQALLPTPEDDVRQLASLYLPRDGRTYYLGSDRAPGRLPIQASQAPVQLLLLRLQPQESSSGLTPPTAESGQK